MFSFVSALICFSFNRGSTRDDLSTSQGRGKVCVRLDVLWTSLWDYTCCIFDVLILFNQIGFWFLEFLELLSFACLVVKYMSMGCGPMGSI